MGDKFDPYREGLVVEQITVWPEGLGPTDFDERANVEARLHVDAEKTVELKYVRLPTGFCRQITVTEEDLARLSGGEMPQKSDAQPDEVAAPEETQDS